MVIFEFVRKSLQKENYDFIKQEIMRWMKKTKKSCFSVNYDCTTMTKCSSMYINRLETHWLEQETLKYKQCHFYYLFAFRFSASVHSDFTTIWTTLYFSRHLPHYWKTAHTFRKCEGGEGFNDWRARKTC